MSETPGEPTFDYETDGQDGDHIVDLDQALGDEAVDDMLDTSYSPPERPSGMTSFGTTLAEEQEGERLDDKLAQEVPDPNLAFDDPLADSPHETFENEVVNRDDRPDDDILDDGVLDDTEVGQERAGRLVAPDEGAHEDAEKDMIGSDVGIDGAAAGAEEAAVHIVADDAGDVATDEGSSL